MQVTSCIKSANMPFQGQDLCVVGFVSCALYIYQYDAHKPTRSAQYTIHEVFAVCMYWYSSEWWPKCVCYIVWALCVNAYFCICAQRMKGFNVTHTNVRQWLQHLCRLLQRIQHWIMSLVLKTFVAHYIENK